tara:strand:- start:4422 stop:4700 length:279 start_codon:yes stop_codon:yes gene_type:complete
MKYDQECLEYLHKRRMRGSLNQGKVTVHELANNTSVPSWVEAKSLINKFYLEGYDEQSKDETPEGTETEAEKEASTFTETGNQSERETSGEG